MILHLARRHIKLTARINEVEYICKWFNDADKTVKIAFKLRITLVCVFGGGGRRVWVCVWPCQHVCMHVCI